MGYILNKTVTVHDGLPLWSFVAYAATKNEVIPNDKYNRPLLWIAY